MTIKIKQSPTADTRTCDVTQVTKLRTAFTNTVELIKSQIEVE